MIYKHKLITLMTIFLLMSVGWGQGQDIYYTQEKITISDEEIIISNYDIEGHTYSDTTYIPVSRLLPPCNGGYTEIDSECYYQSDLDVLQIFIDNSYGTINMDMDVDSSGIIEPLELGNQGWSDGRITSINCYYYQGGYENINCELSGELPVELGNLTNLVFLSMYQNNLEGDIPPEIGDLVNLTHLDLDRNDLNDEVPPDIENLINLNFLSLYGNNFDGEIPIEIWNLTNLVWLNLGGNDFFGVITEEVENLVNVKTLLLGFNNLDGVIPPEFGNLTSLECTYLQYNNFSGELPSEIGNLTNLWGLFLYNNPDLNGEIPESIGNLTNLSQLSFHSNNFDGEIPESFGNLTNLHILRLNDNQLNGFIPDSICNLEINFSYSSFDISNNEFCPPYPECIENYVDEQDTSECVEYQLGDVNMDGSIDMLDILVGINILLDLIEYTDEQYELLDFNQEGECNILDLVQMVNYILDI